METHDQPGCTVKTRVLSTNHEFSNTEAALAAALDILTPWQVQQRYARRVGQVEVTSLLLETLARKLATLREQLQSSSAHGATAGPSNKETLRIQLIYNIGKVQGRWDQLEREYTQQAIGVLRCGNTRGSGKGV
ncbi:uncharacterized protein LOC122263034 [Penaeus japonicus]|uniref:uncharacterized protein LOC122263034 n=1 Tax=Penaeus japonicus TaxID=27405 RepID=UPI001C715D2E|nr:uncharacterized protein LOC122263034 [Penaeus japonicus]